MTRAVKWIGLALLLAVLALGGLLLIRATRRTPVLYAFVKEISQGMQPASSGTVNMAFLRDRVPTGITIDRQDRLYLVNDLANTITRLDADGALLTSWANFGAGRGPLLRSSQIAVDGQGRVFVNDCLNRRIVRFTDTGAFQGEWKAVGEKAPAASAEFDPPAMAVDARGQIFLAFRVAQQTVIVTYDSAGKPLDRWQVKGIGRISALAVAANGDLYGADIEANRILQLRSASEPHGSWGGTGDGPGEFNAPRGLAIDASGNLYVADTGNHRVQKFAPGGNVITIVTEQLDAPEGLAIDGQGNLYVADAGRRRVLKYRPLAP